MDILGNYVNIDQQKVIDEINEMQSDHYPEKI